MNNNPITTFECIDWDKMERDVVSRIHILKATVISLSDKLEDAPAVSEIWKDLIIPDIALLRQFVDNIEFTYEVEAPDAGT